MARKFLTGIDNSNQRGLNFADPSAATDAANKQYVDNVARSLFWKQPVRAASTANISLTAPGSTLDGVTLTSGDRILLKDQTTQADNGIYTWTGASATLTRTADADNNGELAPGTAVTIIGGTVNGDKVYLLISDAAITVGTTAMTWGLLGGGGTSYSAGSGLLLAGSVFSIDTSIVTRKKSSDVSNTTSFAFAHNLGTLDVQLAAWLIANGEEVECDKFRTDANTATFAFATAPAAGTVRVSVQG